MLDTTLMLHSTTNEHQSLIDYYKAIETASRKMLEAAQCENWDEVVQLEGACAVLIEQLRAQSHVHHLSAQERSEKQRIMLSILRHDAEIRNLAEPWLADIDHMLGSETRFLH
ncbi:MAG: flagellar protein FliT [Burkholderiaceae bacterium]|jgi:flagellar protein FliT|nr:flagellar protein FliT [Burkholderiaceae bacterium]MDZ4163485.1 flagellar protein FliT [Burkholderiales bacterium]